jgi:hypothetical protein
MHIPKWNVRFCAFASAWTLAAAVSPTPRVVVWAAPMQETEKILSEQELFDALRVLREQALSVDAQLLGFSASSLPRPDRKRMRYDEYRTNHQTWKEKINQGYERLRNYYAQVERTYRANPNSPLYKRIYQAYVGANEALTKLNTTFAAYPTPENSQIEAVIVADGRLERRLHASDLTAATKSAGTHHDPATLIAEADEIRYIGRFDTIELYVCVKGQDASYVLSGLREPGQDAAGRTVDAVKRTVLVSVTFAVSEIQSLMPKQHLDQVLKLKLTPLGMETEAWNVISDSLARARSYSKGN